MAIDINNNILEIEKTATTDADYTGKKIVELPDTVINSAQELKERFDAAMAHTGEEAFEKIESYRPDLILLE